MQQQPELFGRHAQGLRGSNAYTFLLDLARRLASLVMAYGFDIENEIYSEEDDEEEADGSSQSAYELNKGMVPFADLSNAGTSGSRRPFFLTRTPTCIVKHTLGNTLVVGLVLRFLLRLKRAGLTIKFPRR